MKILLTFLFPVFLASAQSKLKPKLGKRSVKIKITGKDSTQSNNAYFKAVAGTGWHFSAPKGETIEATTNVMTYKQDERDLYIKTQGLNKIITRDFGTIAPLHNWKITGNIWYNPSGEHGDNFTDILDTAGRVIARLQKFEQWPFKTMLVNRDTLASGNVMKNISVAKGRIFATNIAYAISKFQPFIISEKNGQITIQYADYPAITKPPVDPLANASFPAKLRITLSGKGEHVMDIGLLRLYFNQ